MRVPAVKTATPADEASAVGTVVLAFAADPVARWCWPDSHQYLSSMPGFTMAFGGGAFARQSALCTEDFAGAALWLPPNVHPEEEIGDSRRLPSTETGLPSSTRGELLHDALDADGSLSIADEHRRWLSRIPNPRNSSVFEATAFQWAIRRRWCRAKPR